MIRPITFEEQIVGSKNDGGVYRNIYPNDGILWGCGMTVTGTQIEIASGMFVLGGRMIWVDGKTVFEVKNPIQNGYARLKAKIDLNAATTQEECGQFATETEFSTTELFPGLTQEDINDTGKIYEQELAVVKIEAGNVTGIVRKLEGVGVDAEKLGGKAPEYYKEADKFGGELPAYYAKNAEVVKKSGNQTINGTLDLVAGFAQLRLYTADRKKSAMIILNADNTAGVSELQLRATKITMDSDVTFNKKIFTGGEMTTYGNVVFQNMVRMPWTYANPTPYGSPNTWISDNGNANRVYVTTSLRRHKDDIRDVTEEEALKAYELRPTHFKGKGNDAFAKKYSYGFIAEEVEEVLYDLASHESDGTLNGVMYDRIPALLLKQNQMQKKQIETLEEKMAKLESGLDALEAKQHDPT